MLSKRLENLHPYVPGEQPKDRDYIKLNANENPYPPCANVANAIKKSISRNINQMGLYPDPDSNKLRKAIADMLNETGGVLGNTKNAKADLGFTVTPEMIFCGNGSDEVLSFLFYSFFDSDRPLILPKWTYSFYPVYCEFYNIPMNPIPLQNDWQLDMQKMLDEANKTDSAIIFANPNAPTGLALKRSQVEQMIQQAPKDRIFIVDEAYADFGDESCIPLLQKYENLVVVRTFSKSLSLAGMRLGFIVAAPKVVQSVFVAKNSFNHFPVDAIAQIAGIATCESFTYYEKNAKKIIEERQSFIEFLKAKNWTVLDSKTNFVFTKKEGLNGKDVYETVKRNGILIRHFNTPGIEDFVRITIGDKNQMNKLKTILEAL